MMLQIDTRYQRWLLISFILLAYALRLYHLDHFSFWIDEALTPLRTSYSLADIVAGRTFIQEAVSQDTHPPLYYLLIYVTRRLLGESDFTYRYPSLLMGVLLVPVLFQLGRRLFGSWAGLAVAGLTAVNPLQIWYAQEARMYTQLVLLGALMSYALWRGMEEVEGREKREERKEHHRPPIKWFVLYLFLAGLTLYTHYTAVFLIGLQALLWVWIWWRSGYKRLILVGGVLLVLAALPLIPLTVPRLFTGAESGYRYRSPLVILYDVISGFSMGVTAPDVPWLRQTLAWSYAGLLGLAAVTLWQRHRTHLAFLGSYLLAVAVGLSLGSLIKPMYLGVRHIMLGSPAFLLLMVAGGGLWSTRRGRWGLLTAVTITSIGSLGALNELYRNPAVAKDDLRGVVAYLEARAGDRDAVIYNDAILMLAHWHYQTRDDVTVTAVPVYPHMVRPATAEGLQQLRDTHERLWFIPALPGDGRDEAGFVRQWMVDNVTRLSSYALPAKSTELKVELYTPPHDSAPPPTMAFSWAGLPTLTHLTADLDGRMLWLDTAWQGAAPPEQARLILALRGADGHHWLEQSWPFWLDDLWPTTAVRLQYGLALSAGLPPGEYDLLIQGWDENNQRPLGSWQAIIPVELPPHLTSDTPATGIIFDNGVRLVAVDAAGGTAVRPGNLLPVGLLWHGAATPDELRYEVQLLAPDGQVVYEADGRPGARWLTAWAAGQLTAEPRGILIPAEAEAGVYTLRWRLLETGVPVLGQLGAWSWAREWQPLGTVTVEAWPLVTQLPPVQTEVGAQFGPAITLHGYDQRQMAEQLDITLVWQAQTRPAQNYHTFLHVVDAQGEIVTQAGWIPDQGRRPTRSWRPDEVLPDPYTLDIGALPAGRYRLNVGLYNPDDGVRPVVTQTGRAQADGQLFLQEIVIE